jgi:hypothetical protein
VYQSEEQHGTAVLANLKTSEQSNERFWKHMVKVNSKSDLTVAKRIARKTGNTVVYKAKGKRGTGRIVPFADGRVVVFGTR